MAKLAKNVSMGLETKAADILYDASQECELSLTAFIEKTAYYVQSLDRDKRQALFTAIINSEMQK